MDQVRPVLCCAREGTLALVDQVVGWPFDVWVFHPASKVSEDLSAPHLPEHIEISPLLSGDRAVTRREHTDEDAAAAPNTSNDDPRSEPTTELECRRNAPVGTAVRFAAVLAGRAPHRGPAA